MCRFIDQYRIVDNIPCGRVLVHCEAGLSRGPTAVMAYLIFSLLWRLPEVLQHVKEQRRGIVPQFEFIRALCRWDEMIHQLEKGANDELYIHFAAQRILALSSFDRLGVSLCQIEKVLVQANLDYHEAVGLICDELDAKEKQAKSSVHQPTSSPLLLLLHPPPQIEFDSFDLCSLLLFRYLCL